MHRYLVAGLLLAIVALGSPVLAHSYSLTFSGSVSSATDPDGILPANFFPFAVDPGTPFSGTVSIDPLAPALTTDAQQGPLYATGLVELDLGGRGFVLQDYTAVYSGQPGQTTLHVGGYSVLTPSLAQTGFPAFTLQLAFVTQQNVPAGVLPTDLAAYEMASLTLGFYQDLASLAVLPHGQAVFAGGLDTWQATVVPLPAAAWLLGAGVAGLAVRRKAQGASVNGQ